MGTPKFHRAYDERFIHKKGESDLLMEVTNPTIEEEPGLIIFCCCDAVRTFRLW
jgi:hypothetical protein